MALKIKIRYTSPDVPRLKKIEKGDWIDVYAAEDVELKSGEHKLVSLGFACQLPKGYEAYLLPRSSTYRSYGIILGNNMGVIDESYRGNDDVWKLSAIAMHRDTKIGKGDRIGQFRIMKKQPEIEFEEVEELEGENRGGFGSTGIGAL